MAIEIASVLDTLKKYNDSAATIIGQYGLNRFKAFLSASAIFGAGSKSASPPLSTALEWIAVILFSISFIYLMVGFFLHFSGPSEERVVEGLIAGAIAGMCACVFGGAIYYGFNFQDCYTTNSVIKFIRLFPNCVFIGSILGCFFGSFPPIPASEKPVTSSGGTPQETRIADLIVFCS